MARSSNVQWLKEFRGPVVSQLDCIIIAYCVQNGKTGESSFYTVCSLKKTTQFYEGLFLSDRRGDSVAHRLKWQPGFRWKCSQYLGDNDDNINLRRTG